jgi:hypothetical protein
MPKGSFDLRAWALVGAQQRLRELDEERTAIFSAFPQLRGGAPARRLGRARKVQADGAAGADGTGVKKQKKRKMSAAARKRISDAQKARWAKQKKAASKSAGR